jgi:hypothetical protein
VIQLLALGGKLCLEMLELSLDRLVFPHGVAVQVFPFGQPFS